MSWKRTGHLVSGPPSSSLEAGSSKLSDRIKPNRSGAVNAFQRERELASRYGYDAPELERKSEWDVLKENHRFIRDDEEPKDVSWEERLARAYESKLFKEFALIDLKHYKSKRFALRWRTAPEVVDGIGEETCGSLRCKYHQSQTSSMSDSDSENDSGGEKYGGSKGKKRMPKLRAFELPFQYLEEGKKKEALVKVRLCPRCEKKLRWKPNVDEEVVDTERKTRQSGGREEPVTRNNPRSRSRSRSPNRDKREKREDRLERGYEKVQRSKRTEDGDSRYHDRRKDPS